MPLLNLILVTEINLLHPIFHWCLDFGAVPQKAVGRHACRERPFVELSVLAVVKPEGPRGKVPNAAIYN